MKKILFARLSIYKKKRISYLLHESLLLILLFIRIFRIKHFIAFLLKMLFLSSVLFDIFKLIHS